MGKDFKQISNFKIKSGFTLAEVLITLGIIGIVAAMTLPTLIQKHQEKQTVTKVRVFYSKISNAYKLAVEEEGSPEDWDLIEKNNIDGAKHIYEKLSKHLKIIKDCGAETGCMAEQYHYKDGSKWYKFGPTSSLKEYKFVMADGLAVYIQTRNKDCNESFGETAALKNVGCAFIGVDVNGKAKPNALGKDLFIFILTRNGVIPRVGANYTSSTFENNCIGSKVAWACSAWVVANQNMDYLHCDDLSWEGKHSCNGK